MAYKAKNSEKKDNRISRKEAKKGSRKLRRSQDKVACNN